MDLVGAARAVLSTKYFLLSPTNSVTSVCEARGRNVRFVPRGFEKTVSGYQRLLVSSSSIMPVGP